MEEAEKMHRSNYIRTADELVAIHESATTERGYVPDSFCTIPAGIDNNGMRLTLVSWRWQLPALDSDA